MNIFLLFLSKLPFIQQQCVIYLSQYEIKVVSLKNDRSITELRVNPHPRTLIADPLIYENQLKSILKKLFPNISIITDAIVCLKGLNDGDYTLLERRSLKEFTKSAAIIRTVYLTSFDVTPDTAKQIFSGKKLDALIE